VFVAQSADRRIGQSAVEAAIRVLGETRLKTQTDAMLRTFLAFKAAYRDGSEPEIGVGVLKEIVEELFVVLPTPSGVPDSKYSGTIALRSSKDRPLWMKNDSFRGSFLDYAGPTSPGRRLFRNDDWHEPLQDDAVKTVADTLGGSTYAWPPADVVAAIALRNELLTSSLGWAELIELARKKFGLSAEEWEAVTSSPALKVAPFDDNAWDPGGLSADLRPPGLEKAEKSEVEVEELPAYLRQQVERILTALANHGQRAIIAVAGVPGTSKSHAARRAAAAFASEECVREIQFSPGYTYEEFMEGPRYGEAMKVGIEKGIFLALNKEALDHPNLQYVLLIEELTRADIPRVLGELLTYVEYRGNEDSFTTIYDRNETVRIAPNIAILATYNPTDRSAVNIDAALLRRMRILDFPPDTHLLAEILTDNGIDEKVIERLKDMFEACREVTGSERFSASMPFGHAVFTTVEEEKDLYDLWHEELKHILVRPHAPPHELFDVIAANYPWKDSPIETVVADDLIQPAVDADGTSQ
jgi:MoxR-like ATPase